VATAIISAVLTDAIGGTQTVALNAGRLGVVTGATRATASVISAELVFTVGLAGLEAAPKMAPGNRIRTRSTGGATAVIAADLSDAAAWRALALEAIRVATAHPTGAATAI
jgi:hypothetical protein